MKFIAIAVASAIPAYSASAATVFENDDTTLNIGGRIEVRGNISDANKDDENKDNGGNSNSFDDKSRARLSVDGKKTISNDVAFVGKYEFELTEKDDNSKDDTEINTRHLYTGVESSLGNLYYGHQNNALTYLTDWTDMAEVYSGYVNEYTVASADRAKNVLRYTIATDSGLTFQVSGNFNSESEYDANRSDGYSTVLAYSLPMGVELGIGYASSDETYGNGTDKDTSDAYILAARYTNENGISAATMYQAGSISKLGIKDSDYNAVETYLGYSFGDNAINLTYNYFSADDIDELDIQFVAAEYARYFGNVALYGSYKYNLLDNGDGGYGDNDKDELMLGMRYAF